MSKGPLDRFDAVFGASSQEGSPPDGSSEPPRIVAGEPHAKLRRNLHMALDRHGEILSQPITEETDPKHKRLVAEVATATVKAANSTDRTALKARDDSILGRFSLRVTLIRWQIGYTLEGSEIERVRRATRAEIEAALNPREIAEFHAVGGVTALISGMTLIPSDRGE